MKNVTYYNAGAGSGKTYKLTHVLAERIKQGLNPAEVILTTFTKSAAADFKERARAVLYSEGLNDKAAMLDQAVIGTVHSIGQAFIERYWYLLGLSPVMKVMDEDSTKIYISQSLAALPTPEDIRLFRKFRNAFNLTTGMSRPYEMFWKDWLSDIIGKAVSYRVEDLTSSKEYSVRKIKEYIKPDHDFNSDQSRFVTVLNKVAGLLENDKPSAVRNKRLDKAKPLMSKTQWEIPDYVSLGSLLKDLPKKYRNNIPELDNYEAELAGIWHSNLVFDLVANVVNRIYDMAEEWRKQYKEYKQEHRIIDFNDMEYYFLELLKHPDIASEIKGRYKCLMVDEFQDSSPIQVDIFNHLSELVEESYWCGDSKQAIYGFRGADTDLTEAVVGMIPADRLESLDTSYRSEPAVVRLCNSIFTRAFKDKLSPEKIILKEHREKTSEGPNLIQWNSTAGNSDRFMKDIARYIKRLNQDSHIPFNEMAVLADKNLTLDTLAIALAELHIPVNRSSAPLSQLKETELMAAILTLIVNRHNQLAKAKIVYLAEKGWKLDRLIDDRLQDIDTYTKYQQRLNEGEEVPEDEVPAEWLNDQPLIKSIMMRSKDWISQSVSAQVESVLVELNLRSVMKSWGEGWEQREANLYKIVALAEKYEDYCNTMTLGATTTGFLDYLSSVDTDSAGNSKGVVLSTYHNAKGLQWNNVIMLSLDRNVADDKKIVKQEIFGIQKIRTVKPSEQNLFPEMIISLIPWLWGKSGAPDDISSEVMQTVEFATVKRKVLEESARLLYVGMTRARDRLITTSKKDKTMPWVRDLGINVQNIPEEGEADIFDCGLPFTIAEPLPDEDKEAPKDTQTLYNDIDTGTPANVTYARKFVAPSNTGLNTKGEAVTVASRGERIPYRGSTNIISEIGTCIHNIYAACTQDRAHNMETANRLISAFHFEKVLPDASEVIAALEYLYQWLAGKHGQCTALYHELPFIHAVGDQIVRGSMDLVWETAQGCVLIDFKTFPGSHENITDPNNDHYAGLYKPQFDCYHAALQAAGKKVIAQYVYYPVSGMIVEIK